MEPESRIPNPESRNGQRPPVSVRRPIPPWAGALAALLVMSAVTACIDPSFLRPVNLVNILKNNSAAGIVATGMTLVILLGGIDLSVGALLAFAGGLGIAVMKALAETGTAQGLACFLGALTTLSVATAAGAINGLLVSRGRLAPFIATLGSMVAYRSATTWIARGGQFFCNIPAFAAAGRGLPIPGTNIARSGSRIIPLEAPYVTIAWLLVVLAALFLVHRMRLGRYIVAVGSNERAASYAAVPVRLVKFAAYTILGALTGLAAFLPGAQYTSINSATSGLSLELDAIAAVVIGGTRMEGGRGSIVGTVVGILLLGVIRNMMVMLGVNTYAQGLVQGVIIIAAVLAQRIGRTDARS